MNITIQPELELIRRHGGAGGFACLPVLRDPTAGRGSVRFRTFATIHQHRVLSAPKSSETMASPSSSL